MELKIWSEMQGEAFVMFMQYGEKVCNTAFSKDDIEKNLKDIYTLESIFQSIISSLIFTMFD